MSDTFTVGELCAAVRAVVDDRFPDEVWVKGAISGLTRSPNGHVYFDLVDASDALGSATEGVLPVALFAASRHRVNAILRRSGNMRMHDGVEIRIRGQVAYYPPQGRIQLVMSLIDPAYTMGQMAVARQRLLDTLAAEGLLEANGTLPVPPVPLRVGLVTSDGSAAHADFVHELDISGYTFDVTLFDTRVQGLDAVPSLVEGIDLAGAADVDVVVVVRGGGARTDLAAFDHERVARAIARCPRPVIVGVGHEVDRSVADEVAHTSAKTPTATAAVLVGAVREFAAEVELAAGRLVTAATARLATAQRDLDAAGHRLMLAANASVAAHHARVDGVGARLGHRFERALDRADATLDRAAVRLRALDPAAALARGWTITHTAAGELVRDASALRVGSAVVTTTATGRFASTVTHAPLDTADSAAVAPATLDPAPTTDRGDATGSEAGETGAARDTRPHQTGQR